MPFDTALGGTLAVFFGLGLAVMTGIRRIDPEAAEHGLERYLFGQAAIMRGEDLRVIGRAGAVIGLAIALLWKEFKLLSFDPDFAAASGLPVRALDLLLTALIVVGLALDRSQCR